jgi:hypothetical protein
VTRATYLGRPGLLASFPWKRRPVRGGVSFSALDAASSTEAGLTAKRTVPTFAQRSDSRSGPVGGHPGLSPSPAGKRRPFRAVRDGVSRAGTIDFGLRRDLGSPSSLATFEGGHQ